MIHKMINDGLKRFIQLNVLYSADDYLHLLTRMDMSAIQTVPTLYLGVTFTSALFMPLLHLIIFNVTHPPTLLFSDWTFYFLEYLIKSSTMTLMMS